MDNKNNISKERNDFLKRTRKEKIIIKFTQFSVVIGIILLWEILANNGIIDSFIMSSPSRIIRTFLNLFHNNLAMHIGVTCLETITGFLIGTFLRKHNCNTSLVVKFLSQSSRAIFGSIK